MLRPSRLSISHGKKEANNGGGKAICYGTRALLNQCFLIALDFESMFRAGTVKILLQQYRHEMDVLCVPANVCS
jgi:hypothetical protein